MNSQRRSVGNFGPNLTRRRLLQHAGWITAAAAFPQLARAAANDVSPVMEKLSTYMAEARNRALPDNVLQETKHHILDTIAAMVSGSELPPGRMAIDRCRWLTTSRFWIEHASWQPGCEFDCRQFDCYVP